VAHATWIDSASFKQAAFCAWLADQGAVLMRPTNEYELVRYKLEGQLAIVWDKPSKRRVTLGKTALKHYQRFLTGKPLHKPEPVRDNRPAFVLYTDAGNWQKEGLGTWAGILLRRDPEGAYTEVAEMSGAMAREVTSSTAAEAMAVANSVHRVLRDKHLPPRAKVTVVCDNESVVRYIGATAKHKKGVFRAAEKSKSEGVRDAFAHLRDLAERFDLMFKARWVKGHQPLSNAGHDANFNRRCDALCRKAKP
jgi:ribonuclease HI